MKMTIRVRQYSASEFQDDRRLVVEMPFDFSIDDREVANSFYKEWGTHHRMPKNFSYFDDEIRMLKKVVHLPDLELARRRVYGKLTTLVCLVTHKLNPKLIPMTLDIIETNSDPERVQIIR